MKKQDFLNDLEDLLQREEECQLSDNLEIYEEWDSLAKMAVMAYFKNTFQIQISLNTLNNVKTVEDLVKIAGNNIDD